MDLNKRIMKAFVTPQFDYLLLTWMINSRELHKRVTKVYEQDLWLVYEDKSLPFVEFIEKNNSVTMQQRDFRCLLQRTLKFITNYS